MAPTVTFQRGNITHELNIVGSKFTAANFSRMFNVEEGSVWLRETFGSSRPIFPDRETGEFDLSALDPYTCPNIDVMGTSSSSDPPALPPRRDRDYTVSAVDNGATNQPGSSGQQDRGFNSVLPNARGNRRSQDNSFSVKIVQARMSAGASATRPDFRRLGQAYVVMTERQANVDYILRELRAEFGDGHVLVTSDGLEIRDSQGTRGGTFWRQPARKFYAIPQEDLSHQRRGTPRPAARKRKSTAAINLDTSDSDSDFESTRPAAKKPCNCACKEGIFKIQQKLDRVLSLTPSSKIPLGLKSMMQECFSCIICKGFPITPPVIFSKCCRSVLGCEKCVHEWFTGAEDAMTQMCPKCRAERGFAETVRLNGLDEFLDAIRNIRCGEENDEAQN